MKQERAMEENTFQLSILMRTNTTIMKIKWNNIKEI